MRVGVGHQPVPVQTRHPPVHLRIGRQARLDGEDVRGQVRIAVRHPVEPGLRAEHREPRRPSVRGHQVAAVAARERDLEQVARVEPEDRPAVRGQVPHPEQPARDLVDRIERRRVEQVVDLPRAPVALVDRGDLRRQQEPDRRPARGRQRVVHRALELRPQPEQPRRIRHQLGAELLPPRRVREVTGADDADALAPGPPGQCSRSQSRLQARENLEWMCRSAYVRSTLTALRSTFAASAKVSRRTSSRTHACSAWHLRFLRPPLHQDPASAASSAAVGSLSLTFSGSGLPDLEVPEAIGLPVAMGCWSAAYVPGYGRGLGVFWRRSSSQAAGSRMGRTIANSTRRASRCAIRKPP